MPTMPSNITAAKNSLSQEGAWVWLLTFALPRNGPVLRFCSNTENLTYGGHVYGAFNFSVGNFEWNCDGEIPELTMVVTNVGFQIQEYVRDYGGLVGSEVSFVQVNTEYLAEDWDEDLIRLTVVGAISTWPDINLTLSVPSALRFRVPEDRLNPHVCRHAFRTPAGGYTTRCGYAGMAVTSIKIDSPGNAVRIGKAGHPFVNGDVVRIFSVVGIAGLEGDYSVTKISDNYFTLDGTNQGDYSGTFTSGKAGYARCRRIPEDCQRRGMFPGNYSGPLSMRTEGVRYA